MLTGYLHPDYARSFSEYATPLRLPNSGGWLLKRAIDGDTAFDAMGSYPIFCCTNWQGLAQDINALQGDLVSVVLVADPFGEHTPELLTSCFDFVLPFKDHFVIEAGRPLDTFVKKSHCRHARRAMRDVQVELCQEPLRFIDDCEHLFGVLAARHSITGLRRFSRAAFEKQLSIPGMVMFRAVADKKTVSLDLWYQQGECANWHLAATSPAGYELLASYATKWRAIEYFNDKVKWINLGAAVDSDAGNGLSYFKRGWATGTKCAWLCGRVLQPSKYAELAQARNTGEESYFPSYRVGEFN